ncbi:MAG: right-handed parallel beta-helix repeat-containing protein [Cryomorphaceae bacterium]|nr:right-handed parallel beta-helix repeat-containing protein [Cryomorphaceae bacterium]
MRVVFYFFVTCFVLSSVSLTGCKKAILTSKKNLAFSVDTLVFDTVFTTVGSTTQQFKIYNNENKTVRIDEIQLMGGDASPFRMNIDGLQGDFIEGIEIEGKDSLFAFVEVTLNVNNQNLPMIVEDSIRFRTNGKDQYVKLAVWGQDAYFHFNDLNDDVDNPWFNDKPHVIYGYAAVDSAKTLTIPSGTDVYLHKNAILYVYKGTLNIEGTLGNEVTFQGDRLESLYDDVSGQYYGIYLHQARPSTINYAIIKNGTAGIHMFSRDNSFAGYTLNLTNTIIQNNARYGLFLYSGTKLKAENCVISKNGNHALLVLEGSDFLLNHCNLLGYGSGGSGTPAVGISNYYNDYATGTVNVGSINEGSIYNSVIYGNETTEMVFDTLSEAAITLSFDIRNCVIKREAPATESYYSNIYWNSNPLFNDVDVYDFLFPTSSSLNNHADASLGSPPGNLDIKGTFRSPIPDIGAYEN